MCLKLGMRFGKRGVNSGALVMNHGDPSICSTKMLVTSVRSTPPLIWHALRDVMQPAIGMGISLQIEEKYDVESQSDKPGGRHIKIIHRGTSCM